MQRVATFLDLEVEVQLISMTILLVFGFGTVALVAHVLSPHWLWLIPAYCAGSLLGLGVIWLAFALPIRPPRRPGPSPAAEPAENGS